MEPRSKNQQLVVDRWADSKILFLLGLAGCGKTHLSLGLALQDAFSHKRDNGPKPTIMLTRAMVGCDEDPGLFPGDPSMKIWPWLAPFSDVLGSLTNESWEELQSSVDIQPIHVGLCRGRTVSNGVLICDEAQSLTRSQLVCLVTRVGRGGKVVLCGDPFQSDRFRPEESPLVDIAERLSDLPEVSVIKFNKADQQREPLINKILDRL